MNQKGSDPRSKQQLLDEINELRARLAESEESLRAIREGEVDAIIVSGSKGEQVFSLSGSESVYRLIVETMHEAAFTVSFGGQILYCNRQFCNFVNTPQERIIGRNLKEFVPPELGGEVLPLLTRSRIQPVTQRMVFQGAGAAAVPAHISATTLLQPEGESICIVATDLSELEASTEMLRQLRTQQEALQAAELRYRTVADNTYDFEFWINPEGQYLYASPSCRRIYCRDPAEFMDDPTLRSRMVLAEDRTLYEQHIMQEIEQTPGELEYRIELPDGTLRWISHVCQPVYDGTGRYVGLRGSNRDITERKMIEQALQESEARASALIRYAPTAIYEVDFEGQRFISFNDAMCAILGYSRDELMSMDPGEVLDDESQAVFKERVRQQLAGEKITDAVEYKVRRKDGSLIDAILNITVNIEEGKPERALVVAHDITERKKAEEKTLELLDAIHEEKERLSALVNSITDEVWFADTRKRFTLANPSAIREFGLDPDESIDIEKFAARLEVYRPDGTPRPVEESPALLALRGEAVRDQDEIIRTPVSGKLRYRQVNSSPVHDSSGTIIGAVSVVRDITERKRAEEALRQNLDRMLLSSEAARIGVWDWDITGGRLDWDDKTRDIFGVSRETPISYETWLKTIHPDDLVAVKEAVSDTIEGHKDYIIEFRIIRPDDSIRWIHSRGKTFFDAAKKPVRMSGIAFDITERKQAEEAVREAQARTVAILEGIADTYYSLDDQWRFTLVNPAAEREPFGRPASELIGRVIWDLYPNLVGTSIHRHYLDAAEKRRMEHYESKSPLNSRWYEVFMQGRTSGVDVYMRDITERKLAEEAIQRNQKTFLELVERAPFGIYVIDSQFRIAQMNTGSQNGAFLNVRPVIGRDFTEAMHILWPEPTASEIISVFRHTLETGEPYYSPRFTNPRRDVDIVESYEWELHRLTLPDGQYGVICYYFDSTRLREAEEDLRNSEAKFRLLTDAMPQMVWSADADGTMDYYNRQSFAYGGVAEEDIVGWNWESVIHPDDLPATNDAWRRSVETGEVYQIEQRFRRHDGQYRWHLTRGLPLKNEEGRVLQWIGTATDIHDRKTAEIELAIKAQELEAVFSVQTDVALEYDSSMTVMRANPVFREVYGFDPVGRHVIEIMKGVSCRMPDGNPIVIEEQPTPRALRGEKVSGLYFAVTDRAGKDRLVEVSSAPMPLGGHIVGSVTVWHDVTQLKQAEEELRKAMEGLEERVRERTVELRTALLYNRSLIETSLDPIVTIGPDGTITDVNAATESVTGRTRKELISTDFLDYFTEPYHARAGYQKVFQDGYVRDYPLEIRHRDGHVTPVLFNASVYRDEGGAIVGIFAAARDITERRRAELTINAERQRLYDVMEMLPVYVILLSKEYHVPFANRFFRERFGESHGSRCYEYLFNRTEPCETCESYTVMRTNKPHHWEWTGPDRRNYDIYDYPFTDTDGSTMILEMGIDITDVKEAQAALQEANQMLEQRVAERTAELARSNLDLEQFAYVASHDLQEPLRNVGAFVNLLQKRYQDRLDQNANEYIGFALEGVTRMQGLIADLLVYSRVGTRDRELVPIDAASVLERALANLRSSINESGAKVTFDTLPTVTASPVQLTLLLQNLIGNAIKFRGSHTPRVHIGVTRQQGFWVFSIRDNGIGIEPQYQERIFLIFQRLHTREEYPGTGIGLAICKKIVERHGGRIWFDSQPGQGTIFYFTIPAHEGNAP